MAVDYRLDPFQDVLNPVTISGETHTIPSVSPFSIRLAEVPLKETPSSISLTIGGYTATEVSSQPAAGEFWPDYSTGADGDENWNTGTILFNASDAGKTVVVAYKGTGSVVWADMVNTHIITASGTITAPHWATKALVSGCGGGGGGGADSRWAAGNGSAGGVTSFGSLISITGGGGGNRATSSSSIGAAGVDGGPVSAAVISDKYGIGGNPGSGSGTGGKGGNAGAVTNYCVDVVGGQTYTITIGQGGTGGSSDWGIGRPGANGFLMIKWVA